jgi:hypothetical protein
MLKSQENLQFVFYDKQRVKRHVHMKECPKTLSALIAFSTLAIQLSLTACSLTRVPTRNAFVYILASLHPKYVISKID